MRTINPYHYLNNKLPSTKIPIATSILALAFLFLFLSNLSHFRNLTKVSTALAQTTSCRDSDGGVKPYLKGTMCNGSICKTDSCYTARSVKEYYCDGTNRGNYKLPTCPYGCANGACILPPTATSTPIPTKPPSPTPPAGVVILENFATGQSCNQRCASIGLTCESANGGGSFVGGDSYTSGGNTGTPTAPICAGSASILRGLFCGVVMINTNEFCLSTPAMSTRCVCV